MPEPRKELGLLVGFFHKIYGRTVRRYEKKTGAFPEEIPSRLIQMFSIKGDTVLDPFAGTGTTIKVANSLDRLGIGYEINTEVIDKELLREHV